MSKPIRKPLRRSAWTLLLGGLGLLAVLAPAGFIASAQGQPAGPGNSATWAAEETIALFRPIGPRDEPIYRSTVCDVGGTEMSIDIKEDLPPTGAEPRMVTCDREVILQAGVSRAISQIIRSNLIVLPIAMVIIGLVLFVPRFLWTMAWLSTPRSKTTLDDIWGDGGPRR